MAESQSSVEFGQGERGFIRMLEEFFKKYKADRPKRSELAARVVNRANPVGVALPAKIEELRAQEWSECYAWFNRIAHHAPSNVMTFESWIAVVEVILLAHLRPRTFDDHSKIRDLIKEAESGDHA